jgi:hypothetical protein
MGSTSVNIKTSVTGNYLTANEGGGCPPPWFNGSAFAVQTNRAKAAQWETFNLVWVPGTNKFGLQTFDGCFFTAVNGGGIGTNPNVNDPAGPPIQTNRTTASQWEQFTLNSNPAVTFNSPVDPLSGQIGPYLPSQVTPLTVTIQTSDGNFLTAQNGGGMNEDSTGQAISTNRTAMLSWETFELLPGGLFTNMKITIVTGGDDLRQDSGATIQFYSGNQLNPAPNTPPPAPFLIQTLKSPGAAGWGNWSTNTIAFALPQPLPAWVFAQAVISLHEHPSGLEGWDNWDISAVTLELYNFNPATDQVTDSQTILSQSAGPNVLPDGSIGIARLTNTNSSATFNNLG